MSESDDREKRRHEERERLADLRYEAWRSGRNPDAVSQDRFDTRLADGAYADEITLNDVLPRPVPRDEEASRD